MKTLITSIYKQPWLIERESGLQLLDHWEAIKDGRAKWNARNPMAFDDDGDDELSVGAYQIQAQAWQAEKIVFAPNNKWDMRDFQGFDGAKIAVIPVKGPLMKSDFCGSFGTATLRNITRMANQTRSLERIVFLIDSPGGQVVGTSAFADEIRNSPKQTIAICEGMKCSAAYWIGSAANQVFISAKTDIVGSIGTMMSWYDDTAALEKEGIIHREYYASRSTEKNADFREANKGNGKKLIEQFLDPINDVFLAAVQEHRAGKLDFTKEDVLTGKTYIGQAAIDAGLVDGISSLEEIVSQSAATAAKPHKKTTMSAKILAFQTVLVAIAATELPVVDGGFVLTEEQLNKLDAQLEQNQTIIATTAKELKALQASAASVEAIQTELATAKTGLEAAQKELGTLKAENEKLKADAESFQKGSKDFFGGPGKQAQDPKQEDDMPDFSQMAHNRTADELT